MASSASQQVDSRGDRERPISGYPVVPIFILLSQLTNSPNKRINMYYEIEIFIKRRWAVSTMSVLVSAGETGL